MADATSIQDRIVAALGTVREPTGRSVVDAGFLVQLEDRDGALVVGMRNPGLPDPIRMRIERECQAALSAQIGGNIRIEWMTPAPQPQHSQPGHSHGQPGQQMQHPVAGEPQGAAAPNIKHVIAVGSGKGGVGKSTIAASIAYGLRHRGFNVGLMDADVYGPSIPHMLGLSGQPAVADGKYVPPETDGIKTMSMGFLVPASQAVIWRGPMLHKAVRDFLYLVDWGPLDFLIVDLPPGTGDIVLSLSQQMPLTGGVIVCTPQDVALLDARKALSMLGTVKIPCIGIVENMSFFICPKCKERTEIFGHGGAKRWAEESGVPFLGSVPINLAVRINGDEGHLRDNFADDNPVKNSLLDITDHMVATIRHSGAPQAPTLEIV